MRVNLISQTSGPGLTGSGTLPISLTIRPACGLPGDYRYPTDSASLLRLLRRVTNLPSAVLRRFEGDLYMSSKATLLGVDLNDKVLTDIGYYID